MYLSKGKGEINKDTGTVFSQKNLTVKNAYVSNNFGTIFYSGSYDENATVENVSHHDNLYVSSVWKDVDGKTHVICSNDTMYKSTLLVKTDKGDFEFSIPRCPSNWNLEGKVQANNSRTEEQKKAGFVEDESFLTDENGKAYTEYGFSDMPFDIDCVIEENVSELTCYDKENDVQIRCVKSL